MALGRYSVQVFQAKKRVHRIETEPWQLAMQHRRPEEVLDAAVPAVLGSLPALMANLSARGSWKPSRGQTGRMTGRAELGCRGGGRSESCSSFAATSCVSLEGKYRLNAPSPSPLRPRKFCAWCAHYMLTGHLASMPHTFESQVLLPVKKQ